MDRETYIWCDHQDSIQALGIAESLESVGISTWHSITGARFNAPAAEALDHSLMLLIIWSQRARTSELPWLLKIAAEQNKPVVPVTLDGTEPMEDLGADLSMHGWHDLQEKTRHRQQQLARVITRRLATRNSQTVVDKGLNAVRAATTAFANHGPRTVRDACQIVLTAIDHGAPIYNDGDKYGCARIYEMAAKALRGAIVGHNLVPTQDEEIILSDIHRITENHGYANNENADDFAWDLRHAFDALLEQCYRTTAPGVVDLIESRFGTIAQPNAGDIQRLIRFAISEGAPLYDDGCHRECAAIYLKAALTTIVLAQRERDGDSRVSELFKHAEQFLNPVLNESAVTTIDPADKYKWVLEHRAEKFAWDLRHVFEKILRYGYSRTQLLEDSDNSRKKSVDVNTVVATPQRPIFISYARADNSSADPGRRWLDRLVEQFAPLIRQGEMDVWADTDLKAGERWHAEIQRRLAHAKAAVLLVSPAFLASEYIANSELPVLLKRASEEGLTIVPIILAPCVYNKVVFKYPDPKTGPEVFMLSDIQSANPPSKTLEEMTLADQNRVLIKVAENLCEILSRNV